MTVADDIQATYDIQAMVIYDIQTLTAAQCRRYWAMRDDNQSHRMAFLLASQKFPATRTDVDFNRGRVNGNQFEQTPDQGDHLKSMAEAAGVNTTGKWYCRGLADYLGDPTAWVSDRHDVLSVAKAKNLTVHGLVEHEGHEVEAMPDIDVADDVMDMDLEWWQNQNPDLLRNENSRAELREDLRQIRSGAVDMNEPLVADPVEHFF